MTLPVADRTGGGAGTVPTPPSGNERAEARARFVALERAHWTLCSVGPVAVSSVGALLISAGLAFGGPALWAGSTGPAVFAPALEQPRSAPPSPDPSAAPPGASSAEDPGKPQSTGGPGKLWNPRGTGMAGEVEGTGDAGARSGPSASPAPALEPSDPAGLRVPAIDVEADHLLPLQVRSDGELDVPEEPGTVGWYEAGASPGQQGASVISAHVDSPTGPAVFFRLAELRPGDEITVPRADGVDAVFEVYGVEQYSKDDFPTRKVYGSTEGRAELRLVTCGGTFERDEHEYAGNVVVYAELVSAGGAE